jgi:hypothetical protein
MFSFYYTITQAKKQAFFDKFRKKSAGGAITRHQPAPIPQCAARKSEWLSLAKNLI